MNTVKFASQDKLEKEFVTTLKKRINNYFRENNISTKANAAMVFKTIILLNLYLIPFILILVLPPNTIVAILLCVLMGTGIAGVGMGVMHDACHGAYSRKEWINKLLAGTLHLLGSNVLNWKIQHNVLHHSYTKLQVWMKILTIKDPYDYLDIRLSKNTISINFFMPLFYMV
ncbi:MAG: fatty acid desaturase [Bacteroidetes bacterium]|nr:fatty acid desaturase [Bacteroidota bacterium]